MYVSSVTADAAISWKGFSETDHSAFFQFAFQEEERVVRLVSVSQAPIACRARVTYSLKKCLLHLGGQGRPPKGVKVKDATRALWRLYLVKQGIFF